MPLAMIGLVLVIAGVVLLRRRDERWARGLAIGAGGFVGALVAALVVNLCLSFLVSRIHAMGRVGGAPEWSATYGLAFGMVCVAMVLFACGIPAARCVGDVAELGGLLVLALIAVLLGVKVPGELPVRRCCSRPLRRCHPWLVRRSSRMVAWIAAAVALIVLAPTVHAMVVVALGLDQTGTALLRSLGDRAVARRAAAGRAQSRAIVAASSRRFSRGATPHRGSRHRQDDGRTSRRIIVRVCDQLIRCAAGSRERAPRPRRGRRSATP